MPVTPMHPAKPRVPFSRTAQWRMAYELHGWKITAVLAFVASIGAIVSGVRFVNAPNGADEIPPSDAAIFQTEMLHAAAHAYAVSHKNALPSAQTWQTDLRPYLVRAHEGDALLPFYGRRFVMNRDMSGKTLDQIAADKHTLLFWQAKTNQIALPSSAYYNANAPFLGISVAGTAYVATPAGKNTPPFLRPADYERPHAHAPSR